MQLFARLIERLDQSGDEMRKLSHLSAYLSEADDSDVVWAFALLTGNRPVRSVKTDQLKEWALEATGIPEWLFEECLQMSGDLAETAALMVPVATQTSSKSLRHFIQILSDLGTFEIAVRRQFVMDSWKELTTAERYILNKLLVGGFRMMLPGQLIAKALADHTGKEVFEMMFVLSNKWDPAKTSFHDLVTIEKEDAIASRPYPFLLPKPAERCTEQFNSPESWIVEHFWPGIHIQLIKRNGKTFLWTDKRELVNAWFPELIGMAEGLSNGTVLDGQIVPCKEGGILDADIRKVRLGKQRLSKNIKKVSPYIFFVYDLLEWEGKDIRSQSLIARRKLLEFQLLQKFTHPIMALSEMLEVNSSEKLNGLRQASRIIGTKGLVLKKPESLYLVTESPMWFSWKADPLHLTAVLLYVSGTRPGGGYSEFTLGLKDGDEWVPVTKVMNNLVTEEHVEVMNFVKTNIRERFGPVRSVTPELVFTIRFERVRSSSRHKAGLILEEAELLDWRKNALLEDTDTWDFLRSHLLPD